MAMDEFLKQLRKKLRLLPEQEQKKVLDYYRELIEDEIEEGVSEAEAIQRRGSVEEIAKQTLREYLSERSLTEINKDRSDMPQHSELGKRIVITILLSPIWLPLYISGWSVLISFFVASAACGIGGIAYLAPSVSMIASEGMVGWLQCGVCLTAIGLALLLWLATQELTMLWLRMSKWFCHGIRYSFRKEEFNI